MRTDLYAHRSPEKTLSDLYAQRSPDFFETTFSNMQQKRYFSADEAVFMKVERVHKYFKVKKHVICERILHVGPKLADL